MLSQYQYTVEYRQTKDHGNADALSHLPSGADTQIDEKESNADTIASAKSKLLAYNLIQEILEYFKRKQQKILCYQL